MLKKYLEIGKIINKRGISGELKVMPMCDSPDSVSEIKKLYISPDGKDERDVISVKPYRDFLYIKLRGVDSAESADMLRGKILYAYRDDIKHDKGRVFIADLLGLEVKDADTGKVYGKLKEVFGSGSSDIYRITDGEKEYLCPAIPGILISAVPGKEILVRPIPGIFDDAEEIRP